MRPFQIILLALSALLMSASSVSAYHLSITSNYSGQSLAVGDTVTIDVHLDTEGQSNLTILSTAVTFENAVLEYVPASSSAPTFILYSPFGGKTQPSSWMEPFVGTASWNPPALTETFGGSGVYVAVVGFVERALAGTFATTSDTVLATLVFQATTEGTSPIDLAFGPGSTLVQLGDGSNTADGSLSVTTAGALNVTVPEPNALILSVVAVLSLAALRARPQRAR